MAASERLGARAPAGISFPYRGWRLQRLAPFLPSPEPNIEHDRADLPNVSIHVGQHA